MIPESDRSNVAFHVLLPAKAGVYSFGIEFPDGNGGYKRASVKFPNTLTITSTDVTNGSVSSFTSGTIDLTGFVFP